MAVRKGFHHMHAERERENVMPPKTGSHNELTPEAKLKSGE
jgi:hypothetical protein